MPWRVAVLGYDFLGEGGAAVAEQKYEPVALRALLEIRNLDLMINLFIQVHFAFPPFS